ncbi:MAG: xanthine dehydrogenase FAD-binding subunit XdhB, partial [Clostridiales bacterium]|nr:xanthine dehydrogenase FAD-binding subunit XdhB [Clostridiales bacterium]
MFDVGSFYRAQSVEDAVRVLAADPGALPVCGGTDLWV